MTAIVIDIVIAFAAISLFLLLLSLFILFSVRYCYCDGYCLEMRLFVRLLMLSLLSVVNSCLFFLVLLLLLLFRLLIVLVSPLL